MAFALDEPLKWQDGQVHAEYPKATGSNAKRYHLALSALLGDRPPNISVVVKPVKGSGCYRSIRDNESDVTPIPIIYPVKDFDKVNPIQVNSEEPLNIFSTYKVEEKFSVVYADILKSSHYVSLKESEKRLETRGK